ncbi:winged helix DNA-binding domain-containing protein [Actinocorallia sp. API 0066]|uniref:winged helix DNA-binding domain-containing protein n=1 Tax=Actinocorallia sp. API 0066 TaxID=2896846 RepID=UPI0027E00F70|nr:winged helix DNA-binding domain-containing protein [Actinocorallia sp. API 0066]
MEEFTYAQARGLVARRQGLAGQRLASVEDAARVVVGAFGSAPTCYLTFAARVEGFRLADLDRALYTERSLVRVRAMHEMNFAVGAADLPVVLAATHAGGPRARARLLKQIGITEDEYEALSARVLAHLASVPSATGAEIRAALGDVVKDFQYVIALMGRECRLVRAEVRGGWRSDAYAYTAWESWTGTPPTRAEPEEARVELARRYLHGFGPATVADLRWWAGWTVRDTKAALAELDTTEVSVAGAPALVLTADLPDLRDAAPPTGVRLLPYWDALMMGYALPNRAPRLTTPDTHPHVYDKSGNGTSVILHDGVVAGVWDFDATPESLTLRHALFPDTPPTLLPALEAEAALLSTALDLPAPTLTPAPPPAPLATASARNAFMSPIRLAT